MKLRILGSIAGADFSLNPGDVTERFSTAEAIRLIAAGEAVPVDPVPQIETADRLEVSRETRRKKVKP